MENEEISQKEALERYAAEQERRLREALGDEVFEMLGEMSEKSKEKGGEKNGKRGT